MSLLACHQCENEQNFTDVQTGDVLPCCPPAAVSASAKRSSRLQMSTGSSYIKSCSRDNPLNISPQLRCIGSLSGMKTYLISGKKLERDVPCGCSDFVSRSPHPQPRTPDLISRGVQAAQVLLTHTGPEKVGGVLKKPKNQMFITVPNI